MGLPGMRCHGLRVRLSGLDHDVPLLPLLLLFARKGGGRGGVEAEGAVGSRAGPLWLVCCGGSVQVRVCGVQQRDDG